MSSIASRSSLLDFEMLGFDDMFMKVFDGLDGLVLEFDGCRGELLG